MGGDQEPESDALVGARSSVDDIRQCRLDRRGRHRPEARPHLPEEITIFDSAGIALQDSTILPLEYERAIAAGTVPADRVNNVWKDCT